ncbi:uncharacterized protein K444DRAFT_664787 [Hyaloscypha bicolor E]|uniref:Ca2+ regulator and membrane fusion protein Fig1-domain-containing protein n=1 Tax=Hyaloscypha bicolor E TaxID=1095630 RepID=A0A2J6T4X2_9HELO|nr:uncharacterized protein K444DRAFT_664787 [Hyaloscypha bicolor E]PMD58071.1 hypothetical protein K444DRAFT_664787 [Hyaloscypha bicolor E]
MAQVRRYRLNITFSAPVKWIGTRLWDLQTPRNRCYIMITLLLAAIIQLSVILAGCSSPSLKDIYLLSLIYTKTSSPNPVVANASETTLVEVRASYFNLCIREVSDEWLCSSSVSALARQLSSIDDPEDLFGLGAKFMKRDISCGPMMAVIFLNAIVAAFLGLLACLSNSKTADDEDDNSSILALGRNSLLLIFALAAASSLLLTLAAMVWQQVATGSVVSVLQNAPYKNVLFRTGKVVMILGWCAVAWIVIVVLGIIVRSFAVLPLSRLVDKSSESGSESGSGSLIDD